MADSDLSLLFKIRGDASGAKQATAETRAAIASLRSQLGSEFGHIQNAGNAVFSSLNSNLNSFVSQRLPLVGSAFAGISQHLTGLGAEAGKTTSEMAKFEKTLAGLSTTTGKTTGELAKFLTTFVTLPNATERGIAGYAAFGVKFDELNPKLEQAAEEMVAASAATEGLGASMVAAAGPIGIAVLAVAALVAGAVLLTKEFLDLTVSTAEWQGQLTDLSQQTGVSVETLSALEVVFKTTGGSLESATASLGIFQKKLEEAQDPTSKTAGLFKTLGVDTSNTETALRQTLKALASMPEGFHQTATALEVFGRGGKQFLAVAKESNGELDKLIAKMRELGVIVSTEDAKAADDFNDQLAILQFQLRATTATLVKDAIPAILGALKSVSEAIKENRDLINTTGFVIASFVRGHAVALQSALLNITAVLDAARVAWQALRGVMALGLGIGFGGAPAAEAGGSLTGGAGLFGRAQGGSLTLGAGITRQKTEKAPRSTELRDNLKEAELAAKEIRLQIDADIAENKRALDREARNIEDFTKRAIELADQRLNAIIDRVNAEQQTLDRSLAKKLIKQRDYENRTRELTIETKQAVQENENEISKLEDDRDKQIAAAQLAASQRHVQMQEDADARIIASIQDRLKNSTLLESDAEKQIADIIQESFARRKAALEEEQNAYGVSLERRKAITDELIQLEGARAGAAVEASRKIRDALKEEAQSWREREEARRARFAREFEGIEGGAEGIARSKSPIADLFTHINENLTGTKQTAALAGLNALTEGFTALGQAAGSAAAAFVLYGSAGTSFRKFAAEVVASIVQMAVVKAIWELAEGFAALAKAWMGIPTAPGEAAAHFKAAAIYGAVAGVAAVTGRAIAGDAFKSGSGGSGGGSSGGARGGSGSGSGGSSAPITMGSQRGPDVIHLVVEHRASPAFQSVVVDAYVQDHEGGGRTRQVQIKEIKRQE